MYLNIIKLGACQDPCYSMGLYAEGCTLIYYTCSTQVHIRGVNYDWYGLHNIHRARVFLSLTMEPIHGFTKIAVISRIL